jgi:hypothetical protein
MVSGGTPFATHNDIRKNKMESRNMVLLLKAIGFLDVRMKGCFSYKTKEG